MYSSISIFAIILSHPGDVKANPEVMGTHPGAMELILEPWNSSWSHGTDHGATKAHSGDVVEYILLIYCIQYCKNFVILQ
jgi:hypothetical protein